MTRTTADLWHAAGRSARDRTQRRVAFRGLLYALVFLVLGAFLARLPRIDVAALARPLAYIAEPLVSAWREDRDLALVLYLLLQALLQALHWGWYGGALHRLAAVRLTSNLARGEGRQDALLFGLRHARGFAGARITLWLGVLVPIGAVALLALLGRVPGGGSLLLALVVLAAIPLVLAAVSVLGVASTAGFLTGPTIACEDSDAFDAVTRTFTYAAAGLPRIVGLRLLFLLGVLLGTTWRALATLAAGGLGFLALRAGAGAGGGGLDRAFAVLGASGRPPDADRLGIGPLDSVLAGALALVVAGLVLAWLADLVSRIVSARVAVYLLLRRAVDGVPVDRLSTPVRSARHLAAEEAGFVEAARVGEG